MIAMISHMGIVQEKEKDLTFDINGCHIKVGGEVYMGDEQ